MAASLQIEKIIEIDRFALAADFIFPQSQLDRVRAHENLLGRDHIDFDLGTILLGVQSMVLRHNDQVILIDTCVGACKDRPRRPEWHQIAPEIYLRQLAKAGLKPEDIDIVFCTHLHADHIGWNTKLENGAWVPTFPNARYLMSKIELDHWLAEEAAHPGAANHGAFADSVAPILAAGLAEQVVDGFSLGAGLDLISLPGHTPGQIGLVLNRKEAPDLCFCADAFHNPVQGFRPDWSSRFCADPSQSHATREYLLERSRHEGLVIIPSHIRRDLGFVAQGDGIRLLQNL